MTAQFDGLIFRQLFDPECCGYSYLLADKCTLEAVLIDPIIEQVERDKALIEELGLSLIFAMNTHMHADHITGTGMLKRHFPKMKTMICEYAEAKADILLKHGQIINFGSQSLEVRRTPGHTDGCVTYVDHRNRLAFTGDAVLIRGCGRTDFQQGSPSKLYKSVHEQIFSLSDDFLLYPAHDYKGRTVTSVAEEKAYNLRLTKSLEEFTDIMDNLGLAYPKKIDVSLPANKVCGLYELPEKFQRQMDQLSAN